MNRILELVGLRRGEDSVPIGRAPFAAHGWPDFAQRKPALSGR
jgi:hypothetical protein